MATIQNINVGTTTNDGTGDTIRNAFIKTNDNFTSVNSDLALKATLASPTITGTLTTASDALVNGVKVGKGGGNITNNTAVGLSALQANTSGTANTAIGNGSAITNQGGSSNTSLGSDSLFYNISGNSNTAIGKGALQNSTLSDNTAIGQNAGASVTNQYNVTCLGYNAQVTGDAQIQLGNSATTTYVYGTVQNRSDLRDKADVRDTVLGLDFISKLRPVDYKWDMREDYKTEAPSPLSEDATEEEKEAYKIVMDEWLESVKLDNLTHDGTKKRNRFHHGLIAQEVQDIIEETGVDFGGFQDHKISQGQDVLSIGYDELIAPMIKAIQELKAEIELLKAN